MALLAQADQQIEAGKTYGPLSDSAISTLGELITLLPQASPDEVKAFQGLPAHFRVRAQAAGDAKRAEDYRQLASAISQGNFTNSLLLRTPPQHHRNRPQARLSQPRPMPDTPTAPA